MWVKRWPIINDMYDKISENSMPRFSRVGTFFYSEFASKEEKEFNQCIIQTERLDAWIDYLTATVEKARLIRHQFLCQIAYINKILTKKYYYLDEVLDALDYLIDVVSENPVLELQGFRCSISALQDNPLIQEQKERINELLDEAHIIHQSLDLRQVIHKNMPTILRLLKNEPKKIAKIIKNFDNFATLLIVPNFQKLARIDIYSELSVEKIFSIQVTLDHGIYQYFHQHLNPIDKIKFLASQNLASLFLQGLGEFKKFSQKVHLDLYSLAKENQGVIPFILQSPWLSYTLTAEQRSELINIAAHEVDTCSLEELSALKETSQLKKDMLRILTYLEQEWRNYLTEFITKQEYAHPKLIQQYSTEIGYLSKHLKNLRLTLVTDRSQLERIISQANQTAQKLLALENSRHEKSQLPGREFLAFYMQALSQIERFVTSHTDQPYSENNFLPIRSVFTISPSIMVNPPIPRVFHYIWLGGELPKKYFDNTAALHHFAPNHRIILWADNPSSVLKKVHNYFPEGEMSQHLTVMNVQNLLNACRSMFKPEIYKKIVQIYTVESGNTPTTLREKHRRTGYVNYAAASDLIRLLALLLYGGIYLDTDVLPSEPFSEPQTHHGFLHGYGNNNVLLSSPNHPILHLAIKRFLNNYLKMEHSRALLYYSELNPYEKDKRLLTSYCSALDFKRFPYTYLEKLPEKPNWLFGCSPPITRWLFTIMLGPTVVRRATERYCTQQSLPLRKFVFSQENVKPINVPITAPASRRQRYKPDSQRLNLLGIFSFCDNSWGNGGSNPLKKECSKIGRSFEI